MQGTIKIFNFDIPKSQKFPSVFAWGPSRLILSGTNKAGDHQDFQFWLQSYTSSSSYNVTIPFSATKKFLLRLGSMKELPREGRIHSAVIEPLPCAGSTQGSRFWGLFYSFSNFLVGSALFIAWFSVDSLDTVVDSVLFSVVVLIQFFDPDFQVFLVQLYFYSKSRWFSSILTCCFSWNFLS